MESLQVAPVLQAAAALHNRAPVDSSAPADTSEEWVRLLRAAVLAGDEAGVKQLLSQLLEAGGPAKARRRVPMQLKALLNLLRLLRSVALTDDLTGLHNRQGFLQSGSRLLDVARRDRRTAHLVCFSLERLDAVAASLGAAAADALTRQAANFLRDLFPSYGVYEVLGRLGRDEFAALTTSEDYAVRSAVALRARGTQCDSGLPALSLSVGVAHFNPARPVSIDELLENAARAMRAAQRLTRIAPSGIDPPPGMARP
ncbi:MAG: diguanylate cyclase [Steroidobacteraceae bacterium]